MRYQFVDCRWELGNAGRGRELYLESHIPGATFLDVDADLAAPPGDGGRHPLPAAADFAAAAARAGIGHGVFVVAYDNATGGAARLWWLLRHFGHDDCAVLDGGLDAWLGPCRSGAEEAPPAQFEPEPPRDDIIDADELRARLGDPDLVLVDARAPERYRGEVEPIDPIAGRVPGARNLPYTNGARLPDELLTAREIAVYCGSGVTSCVTLLSLARAGRPDGRLYPGSWSEWCRRGDLPVERGPAAATG